MGMTRIRFTLIAGLIALFAIGSAMHAVSAMTMSPDMMLTDTVTGAADACETCPDDTATMPLCDLACTMTFAILPVPVSAMPATLLAPFHAASDRDPPGRVRAAEPDPPRAIIHS